MTDVFAAYSPQLAGLATPGASRNAGWTPSPATARSAAPSAWPCAATSPGAGQLRRVLGQRRRRSPTSSATPTTTPTLADRTPAATPHADGAGGDGQHLLRDAAWSDRRLDGGRRRGAARPARRRPGRRCQVVVDIDSRFRFEQAVFERRRHGTLGVAELCALMTDAQAATYGDGLDPATCHPYMWAVKPHYYSRRSTTGPTRSACCSASGCTPAIGRSRAVPCRLRRPPVGHRTRFGAAELAARFEIDITSVGVLGGEPRRHPGPHRRLRRAGLGRVTRTEAAVPAGPAGRGRLGSGEGFGHLARHGRRRAPRPRRRPAGGPGRAARGGPVPTGTAEPRGVLHAGTIGRRAGGGHPRAAGCRRVRPGRSAGVRPGRGWRRPAAGGRPLPRRPGRGSGSRRGEHDRSRHRPHRRPSGESGPAVAGRRPDHQDG